MPGLLDYAKMVQQLQAGGLLGNVASPMGPLKEGIDNPMYGLEGAKPYGGGRAALESRRGTKIAPAIQYQDGSVLPGKPGMHHADIYEMGLKMGKGPPKNTSGWIDLKTGKFLTEAEAAAF